MGKEQEKEKRKKGRGKGEEDIRGGQTKEGKKVQKREKSAKEGKRSLYSSQFFFLA